MKQIFTFRAGFIPSLVIWQNFVCYWNFFDAIFCFTKETIQREIKAGNRTGTVEQMDANVETMARDLQEILRIGAEQERLWEVYSK